MPTLGKKLLVMTAATCAALLVVECGFRVRAHRRNQGLLAPALDKDLSGRSRIGLIDIIQTSSNDRIVYELRPGLDQVPFKDCPTSTNRFGFRSADHPVKKRDNTVTIVGIGDSIMFGHGVGDGEPYLAALQQHLARSHPEKDWRVINTGVPGYNTVMEVETLRSKCLQFEPDLVILELVSNDLDLPIYIRAEQDVFDPGRSFFWEYVREKIDKRLQGRDPALLHRETALSTEQVPEKYRSLIGWEAFTQALDELKELSEEHGFQVLVFNTFESPVLTRLAEHARAIGFDSVNLTAELTKYMRSKHGAELSYDNLEPYEHSTLVVSPGNPHPSRLHHRMASRKILAALKELGILERLLQGS